MKRILYFFVLLVGILFLNTKTFAQVACGTSGYTNPLTAASGFNVFARQGVTFTSGNSDGTIAMGGNATLNGSFTVAMANSGSHPNAFNNSSNYGLVIGGGVTYTSGSTVVVNNGFLRLGSTTGSRVFYTDCNNATTNLRITKNTGGACLTDFQSTPRIDLQRQQTSPTATGSNGLDFTTAFTTLANQSTTLSTYTSSAPCSTSLQIHSVGSGSISLTLSAHKVNVLNLTGTQLNAITQITFTNQPSATQPLVINVNQTSSFSWASPNFASILNESGRFVIFNFYNNTGTITLTGANTVVGSVLVPNGSFTKNHVGNIEGQVVAQNIVLNGGEVHHQPFEACLINCTATCTTLTSGGTIATSQQYCTSSVTPTAFTSSVNASGGTGGTIKYQWQKLESCGSFVDISGATSSTFSSGSITRTTIFRRKAWRDCIGGTGSNPVYSNEVTVLVVNAGSITGNESGSCNFTPTAITGTSISTNNYCLSNGTAQNQTYQWQQSVDGGANWTNISGATSQNLTPGQLQQTTQYRRLTTVSGFTCNSNVITKTVTTTSTVVSNESFPNTFNTGFTVPINSTFTGSIGTWSASSTNRLSTVVVNGVAFQSSPNALKLVNYNNGAESTSSTSIAQSPTINLSSINTANTVDLSFRLYTYTLSSSNTCYSFNVEFSSNNGSTWTNVYTKTAQELIALFGSSSWGTISLPISSSYFNSSFRYRFTGVSRANCGFDSYLYLDDPKITSNQSCLPCPTSTSAGSNQTKCNNSSFTMAATAPPSGSTGAWTVVSGAATITTASSPTTAVTVTTSPATLRWTVSTPNCGNITSDVVLTNTIVTTANAGSAQTKCNNSSFTMAANAVAIGETGAWTVVSGAATITTASSPTTAVTVTTSPATLRWTITRGSCTSTSDVVLTNNIVTTANAGSAQTKCNNSSFTMAANAVASGETGSWSVVSGAATITTASSPTTALTVTTSPATLRWTITRGSCTSTSDVVLTNNIVTTANAGSAQTKCNNSSFTMAANAAGSGETGAWSVVSGAATITTASSPTTAVAVTTSPATLRWTITRGSCTSTSDVVLTNNIVTTANAGVDQSKCGNSSFTMAANAVASGETGSWSVVSGAATITTASSPTTAVTVTTSPATLRWTITRGSCTSTDDVILTANAGSSIGNFVWFDANNNGLQDVNETGIGNLTVRLYADADNNNLPDGSVIATTTTNATGIYSFTNLCSGRYIVSVVLPSGYVQGATTTTSSDPNNTSTNDNNGVAIFNTTEVRTNSINVAGTNNNVDFGLRGILNLGNFVWSDTNDNGIQNAGEPGLVGLTVNLYQDKNLDSLADGAPIATTITNASGIYSFTNLIPGEYIVGVVSPNGFAGGLTTTTSHNPNNNSNTDNNAVLNIDGEMRSYGITLSVGGEPDSGVDGDGTSGNLTLDFAFTPNKDLGNCTSGYALTSGGHIVEFLNVTYSGVFPNITSTFSYKVTSGSSPNISHFNFGNLLCESCMDHSSDFSSVSSGGKYSIGTDPTTGICGIKYDYGINAGQSSTVSYTLAGYYDLGTITFGIKAGQNIDYGPICGPVCATNYLNLGNLVWNDLNNNGLKDANEPGIAGVTVKLYADANANNTPDGAAIATTTTDLNGLYNFTNLAPGNYIVGVTLGSNSPTITTVSSSNPNNNSDNDNNGTTVVSGELRSNFITLSLGGEPGVSIDGDGTNGNLTLDFGLTSCENAFETFPNQFNTGFSNPLTNATFTGSTGTWTVTSSSNATIVVTTPPYLPSSSFAIKVVQGATTTATSTTTTSPLVNLSNVCCPAQLTLQYTLWTHTVNSADNNTVFAWDFSNDNGVTWNQITSTSPALLNSQYGAASKVTLSLPIPVMYQNANFRYRIRTSKPANNTYDFYVYVDDIKIGSPISCAPTLSLGDYVWLDLNNNGLQDSAEPGIAGATVKLYYDLNNDNIPDGAAIATTTTNSNGAYNFNNLGAYRYIVSVVLPTGYTNGTTTTTSADPNNTTANDNNGVAIFNTNEVRSNSINLTTTNNNVDFGLKGTLNLGNLVWNDTNGNGIKNTFELGVANVTVYLYQDANSDNIPDGSAIATVTTNASGIYSFNNLAPGNYIVGIVPPTGFAKSFTPTSGLTPNNDTDNDNNGVGTYSGIIRTNFITLSVGGEPASSVDGDGTNGNLTLDLAIAKDTDGDNIPDVIDIDDDNDGITDLNESGGYDPLADCDNDGTPNYLDSTPGCTTPSGNDPWGVPYKPLVWTDCNSDGVNDFFDWDRDGIINELDLDSDNDGILDVIEARPNGVAFTSVSNGMITGTDADSNGLLSSAENNNSNPVLNGIAAQDMDRDGTPNFLDLDSDGDGLTDLTEALGTYSSTGVVSGTDTDGDGVRAENFGSTAAATADNINGFGARGILLQDNDNDGKPNAYDIDSDNDGITDNAEGQATCSYKLPTGNDCDGDGVDDAYDMGGCTSCLRSSGGITPFDKDGDGTPDYIDLDTDNDGSLDIYEGHSIPSSTGNVPPINYWVGQLGDTDNDGLINFFDGFNIITATGGSYWRNVINNNMGNNGSFDTGSGATGSISQLPKSQVSSDCNIGDRDWRNITILPVTLIDFKGNLNNNTVRLTWSVTNEINMNQYQVERSADGVNYSVVATINANNGNTSTVVNYSAIDNLNGFNGSTVYYRLKLIEENGSFRNSNVIGFKLNTVKGGITIMPNPAISFVNIKVAAIKDGTAAVKIVDMLGKVVMLQNTKVLTGINTFTFNNLSTLSAGTYTVQIMIDGQLYNEKLIVTK